MAEFPELPDVNESVESASPSPPPPLPPPPLFPLSPAPLFPLSAPQLFSPVWGPPPMTPLFSPPCAASAETIDWFEYLDQDLDDLRSGQHHQVNLKELQFETNKYAANEIGQDGDALEMQTSISTEDDEFVTQRPCLDSIINSAEKKMAKLTFAESDTTEEESGVPTEKKAERMKTEHIQQVNELRLKQEIERKVHTEKLNKRLQEKRQKKKLQFTTIQDNADPVIAGERLGFCLEPTETAEVCNTPKGQQIAQDSDDDMSPAVLDNKTVQELLFNVGNKESRAIDVGYAWVDQLATSPDLEATADTKLSSRLGATSSTIEYSSAENNENNESVGVNAAFDYVESPLQCGGSSTSKINYINLLEWAAQRDDASTQPSSSSSSSSPSSLSSPNIPSIAEIFGGVMIHQEKWEIASDCIMKLILKKDKAATSRTLVVGGQQQLSRWHELFSREAPHLRVWNCCGRRLQPRLKSLLEYDVVLCTFGTLTKDRSAKIVTPTENTLDSWLERGCCAEMDKNKNGAGKREVLQPIGGNIKASVTTKSKESTVNHQLVLAGQSVIHKVDWTRLIVDDSHQMLGTASLVRSLCSRNTLSIGAKQPLPLRGGAAHKLKKTKRTKIEKVMALGEVRAKRRWCIIDENRASKMWKSRENLRSLMDVIGAPQGSSLVALIPSLLFELH